MSFDVKQLHTLSNSIHSMRFDDTDLGRNSICSLCNLLCSTTLQNTLYCLFLQHENYASIRMQEENGIFEKSVQINCQQWICSTMCAERRKRRV
ncbi:hypothetical protein L3Y34_015661 [Caenorhabditis briggsae]|uniref:Uncharacterized protein n=1 Tax=Caenorhabditis briggsae TaxID=6238 RepID=A0AAE9IZM3_CAEBR|nr:hypothetical protein L3Y34_015661 [Caenorhabditis briggsae]